MTQKNSTKRALVASLLAMVMTVTMLMGTTFAWFTDSVTSSGNVIKTGSLKVEMHWKDGKTDPAADSDWTDASNGAIFDYDLWEPGFVQVRHVKIANKGTLDLKYTVKILANGTVSDLADVIDVYYADPAVQVADRAALAGATKIGTLTKVLEELGETGNGTLTAGNEDVITLALVMQEGAGNQYMDKSIGTDFSVVVLATQLASESDSFDNQYDAGAEYDAVEVKTAGELMNALKEGGHAKLANDITFANGESLKIEEGVTATLDLNGKTLSGGLQEGYTDKHVYTVENRGTLTLTGDGVVVGRGVSNYGNLTVESGTYKAIDTNGGGSIWNYSGGSAIINGGTFEAADDAASPGPTTVNVASGAKVTINGGKFIANANQTYGIISNGELVINDIDISADHGVISSSGKLEINGGHFQQNGNLVQTSSLLYITGGKATVTGGVFNFNVGGQLDSGLPVYCAGGETAISGGIFTGYVTEMISSWGGSSTASVTGGTFDKEPGFVASGYEVSEVGGKYTVVKSANVGPGTSFTVSTATELQEALTPTATDGKAIVNLEADIELAAGETWTPLNIDPYLTGGVNQVILNGNGHTIKGLNAPLFGDVHFGSTAVTIKDLTISGAQITNQCYNSGLGAFISYADNCDQISLENCHLVDSTLTTSAGTGVGGLVGYSSAASLTITNCSVTNCTISGSGQSAGAIAGHVGYGNISIANAKVVDCTVSGSRAGKTGYVLGTANTGSTSITTDQGCSGNTVFGVADSSKIYGRLAGGTLTVNGEAMPDGETNQ